MKKLKLEISRLHYDDLRVLIDMHEHCEAEIIRLLDMERQLEGSYIQKALRCKKIRYTIKDLRIRQEAIRDTWWAECKVMFDDLKKQDEGE